MTDTGKRQYDMGVAASSMDDVVAAQHDELEGLRAAVRLCAAHLRSRSATQMSRDEVAALLERAVERGC